MQPVHITYYTDPLCCWSWAMEPHWQRLLDHLKGHITWRYCMGGLLRDWNSFYDQQQNITRPIQMGPLWLDAKYTTGQSLNEKIWVHDPPASSYPACMAVKCAGLQSHAAEHAYLRALREAVMTESKNIAKRDTLLAVAASIPDALDATQLAADLDGHAGLEAFKADLQESAYRHITRFPTLVIHRNDGGGVMLTGYRPFEALMRTVEEAAEMLV